MNPPGYKMMALAIEPDGTMHKLYDLDYETISEAVGGNIQIIARSALGQNLTMYVNEEGKRLGLDFNPFATGIVGPSNLLDGDYIAGTMWVGGPVNDEGEETQLPYEEGKQIVAFVLQHGGSCALSGREKVLLPGEEYTTGYGQN